jgi:ABC-type ATPase with predicted acetyltransferase domain
MKKIDKRWVIRLGSLVLSASLLGTVAALATGGDQTDPLVTLSYLNQTAIPQIVKQVEESAAVKQRELTKTFTDQINLYLQQGGQTGSGGSASYTLVSMSGGQVMSLGVGCEVLLRIGAVTVRADSAPALIDLSGGGTINTGASLTRNHLYMSTIPDRTLTASGDVKLLVRGSYSVA